jgi:hypothetical protein
MDTAGSAAEAIIGLHEAPRFRALLPVPATSFLAREREVAEVSALLTRDDVRLLTLTGPGGVGKTRLAIAVANALKADVPGGVAFVALAPVRRSEFVASAIARVLRVGESGDGQPLTALASFLRRAAMLLVLDKFRACGQCCPARVQTSGCLSAAQNPRHEPSSSACIRRTRVSGASIISTP